MHTNMYILYAYINYIALVSINKCYMLQVNVF